MTSRKRGEPLEINSAMNDSRTKLGLDLTAWAIIVFISIVIFLVGFHVFALISFPTLSFTIWLILRKHPKYFQLWVLRWEQKAYYDPRQS